MDALLHAFNREAIWLGTDLPEGEARQLLARHHGLPSTLLDWTTSPYVAAYFAFANSRWESGRYAAIWCLDRARLAVLDDDIDLIDDPDLLRFNRRALQQRGVFLDVKSIRKTVEDFLGDALTRFDIPVNEKRIALADLDEMMVNATILFYDLMGAARTASIRVLGQGE